jgi:hypothetical protein
MAVCAFYVEVAAVEDLRSQADFPVLIRATFLERRFWPTDRRIGKSNFRLPHLHGIRHCQTRAGLPIESSLESLASQCGVFIVAPSRFRA